MPLHNLANTRLHVESELYQNFFCLLTISIQYVRYSKAETNLKHTLDKILLGQIIWSTRRLVKVLLDVQQKFYWKSSRAIFLLMEVQQIFTTSSRRLVGMQLFFCYQCHFFPNQILVYYNIILMRKVVSISCYLLMLFLLFVFLHFLVVMESTPNYLSCYPFQRKQPQHQIQRCFVTQNNVKNS